MFGAFLLVLHMFGITNSALSILISIGFAFDRRGTFCLQQQKVPKKCRGYFSLFLNLPITTSGVAKLASLRQAPLTFGAL